jgi:hypothetical protein
MIDRHNQITAAILVVSCAFVVAIIFVASNKYLVSCGWACAIVYSALLATHRLRSTIETQRLHRLLVAALLLRVLLTFALEPFADVLEADALVYADHGWAVAEQWRSGKLVAYGDVVPWQTKAVGYVYLNAGVFTLLGFNPLAIKLLNAVLGAITILPVYFLGRLFFTPRVSMIGAFLTAFFPSMVFWSTQNLKYTSVLLLVVTSLYLMLTLMEHLSPAIIRRRLVVAILCLLLLFSLRPEMAAFVTVWILCALPTYLPLRKRTRRFVRIAIASVVLASVFGFSFTADRFGANIERVLDLERLENTRVRGGYGGSAFGSSYSIQSARDFIVYLPYAFVAFLLRPFPWEATGSLLQQLTIVETLVWYPLFLFSILGVSILIRQRWSRYGVLWGFPLVASCIGAVTYGNLGTVYRHRFMVLPFFLIMAAVAAARYIYRVSPFSSDNHVARVRILDGGPRGLRLPGQSENRASITSRTY